MFASIRTRALGSVRYISSKPPKDIEDIKRRLPTLPKKPKPRHESRSKKKLVAPVTTTHEPPSSLLKTPINPNVHYIPFSKFPRAPEHVFGDGDDAFITATIKEPAPKKSTFVDFEIPNKFIKSRVSISDKLLEKERGIIDALNDFARADTQEDMEKFKLRFVKYYYDPDTDTYQPLPEHDLKKSISGMINMNLQFQDIDDEYLWEVFPKDKLFGVPPFELEIHGFKQWEQNRIVQKNEKDKAQALNDQEFREFQLSLTDSKSVYVKSGSRKKINRKLVKKYKELKERGIVPERDEEDNDK